VRTAPIGLVLLALLALLTGCLPQSLDWEAQLEDASLSRRVALAEARILRGGCDGADTEEVFVSELTAGFQGPEPPELAPGTYGFSIRVRGIHCQWFAAGCETVELPRDGTVRVVLESIPEEDACDGGCVDGRCGDDGTLRCSAGFADCNNDPEDGCETDLTNPSTCGRCAFDCHVEGTATADDCITRSNGTHRCGWCFDEESLRECESGRCSDLDHDARNCGSCGNVCSDPPNAWGICDSGACRSICRAGFADCDGETDNGCETEGGCE
jgi:hypothetical protein